MIHGLLHFKNSKENSYWKRRSTSAASRPRLSSNIGDVAGKTGGENVQELETMGLKVFEITRFRINGLTKLKRARGLIESSLRV